MVFFFRVAVPQLYLHRTMLVSCGVGMCDINEWGFRSNVSLTLPLHSGLAVCFLPSSAYFRLPVPSAPLPRSRLTCTTDIWSRCGLSVISCLLLPACSSPLPPPPRITSVTHPCRNNCHLSCLVCRDVHSVSLSSVFCFRCAAISLLCSPHMCVFHRCLYSGVCQLRVNEGDYFLGSWLPCSHLQENAKAQDVCK